MNFTVEDRTTLRRALELAIRQVPLEDGVEFRHLLEKLENGSQNSSSLDGFRYDYTDNF